MVDLRPGKYLLTFTLQGFNVIRRELELPSNFVATINAELAVGTLQESVTVSGQSPLVDVQSNVKQQVLSRDVLDAVPTARTIQGLGQLVPGVTFDQPDVGGSRAMQQTYFFVRGTIGRFANSPAYGDFKVPTWTDISPRTSVVWDIFGNGKTAVRAGLNRFLTAQTTGFARLYAPTALTTANLAWTDVNGDDIAQGERGCTYLTAGCEINFAQLPANFGIRALSTPDPDIQRPGQYSFNLGVTQELFNRLTLTGEWYNNRFTDITERNNVARNFNSYTPVDVVSPLDGKVITVYNVKSEFVSAVQNVDTSDKDIKRHYNGFELGFNARLARGARVFGGFNLEKTQANTCSTGTDPLPWFDLTASASLQSLMGYVVGTRAIPYGVFTFGTGFDVPNGLSTFWQVTRTTRYATNCAAPCRPGELVIPGLNVASLNVPLRAPETEFMPRFNQLDLSLSKTVRYRGVRISPKVDVFNATNSDRWSAITTAQFGAATYLQPSTIMQGRLIRVGIEMSW